MIWPSKQKIATLCSDMKIVYYTSYFGSAEQSINPNSLKYFTFSKNKTANLFFAHKITSIGTSKTAADGNWARNSKTGKEFSNWGTVKTVTIMKGFLMLVTKHINAVKTFAHQVTARQTRWQILLWCRKPVPSLKCSVTSTVHLSFSFALSGRMMHSTNMTSWSKVLYTTVFQLYCVLHSANLGGKTGFQRWGSVTLLSQKEAPWTVRNA